MKIRLLDRFVLASIVFASFIVPTIPGLWQQGHGRGNTEHSVTDVNGKMFIINYTGDPDQNGIYQYSIFLILAEDKTVGSHDDSTGITVVMGHRQCAIPSTPDWHNGDSAWFSLTMDAHEARQFDVYVDNQKVRSFNPGARNAQKVLLTLASCTND